MTCLGNICHDSSQWQVRVGHHCHHRNRLFSSRFSDEPGFAGSVSVFLLTYSLGISGRL